MNTYQRYANKALGVAFIAAPLLLIVGALTFLLGIGVGSFGVSSWVEGLLNSFAFLLFVPIYLKLAALLGKQAPRLAILCAILGLGIGFGILPSNARMVQEGLARAGFTVPIFSLNSPGTSFLFIYLALGMLASILLGIGFLRYGGLPRLSAVLLIFAPIVFIMGQGGDESIAAWQIRMVYPLATVIWFLALAPIGWRLLNGSVDEGTEVGRVQTAV